MANDGLLTEAFAHMLATVYRQNIVIFSMDKFGPHSYVRMMLYKPGPTTQNEIFKKELNELLASASPPYCIHFDPLLGGVGHYSAMKVNKKTAGSSSTVDLLASPPEQPVPPPKRPHRTAQHALQAGGRDEPNAIPLDDDDG